MTKWTRSLVEHLQEVGWVLVVVYLFLGLLVLIFRRQVDLAVSALICLGFALLVTATFCCMVLCNLLGILLHKLVSRVRQGIDPPLGRRWRCRGLPTRGQVTAKGLRGGDGMDCRRPSDVAEQQSHDVL